MSSAPAARPSKDLLPAVLPLIFALVGAALQRDQSGDSNPVLFFSILGILTLLIGVAKLRFDGLGLRGGRPLYAGIGFAAMAWVLLLILRMATVELADITLGTGRDFIYILLFEALALQLWSFGLLFKTIADWRGGLTAAVFSGLLFGAFAQSFFNEAYAFSAASVAFFALWGIFYGMIRLRSGSALGAVIVHTLQSWTIWRLFATLPQPEPTEMRNYYLAGAVILVILIWRLWPRRTSDYRV